MNIYLVTYEKNGRKVIERYLCFHKTQRRMVELERQGYMAVWEKK
jgi:hypothetical protein